MTRMRKEKLIILAIAISLVIGVILMIKFLPLYVTFISLLTFVLGTIAGWYFKKKNVFTKKKELLND